MPEQFTSVVNFVLEQHPVLPSAEVDSCASLPHFTFVVPESHSKYAHTMSVPDATASNVGLTSQPNWSLPWNLNQSWSASVFRVPANDDPVPSQSFASGRAIAVSSVLLGS